MKKMIAALSLFLLFFATSCRDIVNSVLEALPPFDVPFSTTITIPFASVSTTDYTRTPEIPMNINLDAEIKKNDPRFSINNLKSVRLSTLQFDYISSEFNNQLDAVRNARMYLKSPDLPEVLIAVASENTNPKSLIFQPENVELLSYFRTNNNSLILEIQGRRVVLDQMTLKLNTSFKIKVQL